MTSELKLNFQTPDTYTVEFDGQPTDALTFENPIAQGDYDDIRWYLETYAAMYTADPDDERAQEIEKKLAKWGEKLFDAVFRERSAQRVFNAFQDEEQSARLISINSGRPEILSLPWELLKDPKGAFLVHEDPRISVRRNYTKAGGGRKAYKFKTKDRLRLLMVVSRPKDAGFIDPRADTQAVLDALDQHACGRVDVEFLRPATLDHLVERLENEDLPPVDILHFDGHGAYDPDGRMADKAAQTLSASFESMTRKDEKASHIGYLLFENQDGKEAMIPADMLGDMLNRKKIGLMVLSACQSAKVGGEDAMGSVAARLVHAGIPAVIAMTHSVLVTTTRELFGSFYKQLANGKGLGEGLDNARRHLYRHPERGERRRGEQDWITLKVHDWFLPALYQQGADMPLLTKQQITEAPAKKISDNLPELKGAGFFGRTRELWEIETAFVRKTRRLTISGFGGQGKTFLAVEAGKWLVRTGMFDKACFVGYADYQGVDPVGVAVSTLATVLNQSLLDAKAATDALKQTRTLMILDNLESLSSEAQTALLNAAKSWSEAGNSRVLLTTRQEGFKHPEYPDAGTWEHVRTDLKGLHEHDAVAFFQAVMKLPPLPKTEPPKRHALTNLFKMVDFHPLSVGLLAELLKEQRPATVGESLEKLLKQTPKDAQNRSLMASLNLSLQRLDADAQKWLPRLGVFQGGAMEDVLLRVTGLGKTDEDPEIAQARMLLEALQGDPAVLLRMMGLNVPEGVELPEEILEQLRQQVQQLLGNDEEFKRLTGELDAELEKMPKSELAQGADEKTWSDLRRALENTGLIRAEIIAGHPSPFLKFHPTLAPALRAKLTKEELQALNTRHTQEYYRLSGWLVIEDVRNIHVARAIAIRELPNLLHAVHAALDAGDEDAVEFADNVNRFLNVFSLTRDREAINQKAQKLTQHGSRGWFLARSDHGEQLWSAGRYGEAEAVFKEILAGLGEKPTYEQSLTLIRLGRCYRFQGNSQQAAAAYRQGLEVAGKLEQSQGVKRHTGALQTDLADTLTDMGDYAGARAAYQAALAIAKEQNDGRQIGVVNGQLGTLAMRQGNLNEALQRHQEALAIFRQVNEPAMEAVAWNQLGDVYRRAGQWEESEDALRESARIEERRGNLAGAAQRWNNLAIVTKSAGKPDQAEAWYRKAIEGFRRIGDKISPSKCLSNLAGLLQNTPARLNEARQLAEEALEIDKTIDPGAAEIWTTYNILAQIADKQNRPDSAREYRRLAREARARFMGTQHQIRQFAPFIAAVVGAVHGDDDSKEMAAGLIAMFKGESQAKIQQLVQVMEKILAGERSFDMDSLHPMIAIVVETILQGIENPESLEGLM